MTFPIIPNVKFKEILHLSPRIEKIKIIQEKGIKHIILGNKEDVKNAILIAKIKEYTRGGELVNANVWIDISKPKVIIIFGRRGAGKSYDLGIIIEGLSCKNEKIKLIIENHCFLRNPIKNRSKLKHGKAFCRVNKGYVETALKKLMGDKISGLDIKFLYNDELKDACIEEVVFYKKKPTNPFINQFYSNKISFKSSNGTSEK